MSIYLVRHGETDIDLKGWMNVLDYAKSLKKYNRAGIKINRNQSDKVAKIVNPNAVYFSSDLPRAYQTANIVLSGTSILQDKLFREIELPVIKIPIIANYFIWR